MKMGTVQLNIVVLIILLGASFPVVAKQLGFTKKSLTSDILYAYKFRLASGKRSKLSFRLNKKLTAASSRQFTGKSRDALSIKADKASKRIFNSVQNEYHEKARDKFDQYIKRKIADLPAGVSVEVKNKGENIQVRTSGGIAKHQADKIINDFLKDLDAKWMRINEEYSGKVTIDSDKVIEKYYSELYKNNNYVVSFSSTKKNTVKLRIDFIGIAKKYAASMRPVAEAIRRNTQGMSKREVLNYTLNFIQSIPYDTLNSRNANGPIGFVAPPTLFNINKGDCDTKSTALIAILHHLYPDLKMLMVLVPRHAFLAIEVEASGNDTAFRYEGLDYVVVEAAGPALTPVGKAYDTSYGYLSDKKNQITDVLIF